MPGTVLGRIRHVNSVDRTLALLVVLVSGTNSREMDGQTWHPTVQGPRRVSPGHLRYTHSNHNNQKAISFFT